MALEEPLESEEFTMRTCIPPGTILLPDLPDHSDIVCHRNHDASHSDGQFSLAILRYRAATIRASSGGLLPPMARQMSFSIDWQIFCSRAMYLSLDAPASFILRQVSRKRRWSSSALSVRPWSAGGVGWAVGPAAVRHSLLLLLRIWLRGQLRAYLG